MRVGLVLGGGGVLGQAYHAGVLAALEHDLGWDARDAAVIVGTSAGALTGALLARGVRAETIAAWDGGRQDVSLPPALPDPGTLPVLDPLGPGALRHRTRGPGPAPVPRTDRSLRAPRRGFAPRTCAGDGRRSVPEHLRFLDELPRVTPEPPLWITAVRQRDSRRTVFGRTTRTAPLSLAVAASCAVPGYFEPVRIGTDRYIDGGAHSATNADLLEHEHLDLVIAVAPLTTPGRRRATVLDAVRRIDGRRLRTELARLERGGRRTLLFEPDAPSLAAMGTDLTGRGPAADVVRAAFTETGATLARTDARTVRALEDDGTGRRRRAGI